MDKIIILGNGGHAKSLIDVIEHQQLYEIAGYVVKEEAIPSYHSGYPIIGKDEDLHKLFKQGIQNAAIGIGFLGKSKLREKFYLQLKNIGYSLPVICDPSAIISPSTTIEEGTFIGKGVIINTRANIGKMCIINTGAIIEHDCIIGDFSHISVGTVLCGEVKIGKETFIGANATIIQGREIGKTCMIGAGEVLKENIPERTEYRTMRIVKTVIGGGRTDLARWRCAA